MTVLFCYQWHEHFHICGLHLTVALGDKVDEAVLQPRPTYSKLKRVAKK